MRLPLATNIKTRTGAPEGKDARIKNAYVETRGDQSVVRKRPIAQGGVVVGSGIAQGGIDIDGVPYWTWGDNTPSPYTGGGTTWDSGTPYSVGDHVSKDFVDYWALTDNTNQDPTTNSDDWSDSYVPAVPASIVYATLDTSKKHSSIILSNGNLSASGVNTGGFVLSTIGKSSGKWYWEITRTASSIPAYIIDAGVCSTSFAPVYASFVGNDDFGRSYIIADDIGREGNKTCLSAPVPYDVGGGLSQGGILGIALDMDAGTIRYYRNGIDLGIACSGLTGTILYAGVCPCADTITANFGASAFTYSVPSGYNPGLYT